MPTASLGGAISVEKNLEGSVTVDNIIMLHVHPNIVPIPGDRLFFQKKFLWMLPRRTPRTSITHPVCLLVLMVHVGGHHGSLMLTYLHGQNLCASVPAVCISFDQSGKE